jgi:G6PDH family F420-dependent oxidoreductase
MRVGYQLSSEEFTPAELLEQARLAEQSGFEGLWISDHFHPWIDAQGQSSFVWSMIGALSQVSSLPVTTAVTCPIMRLHPAILAQAAATSAVLHSGRFVLGVGTGEALNERVIGEGWPSADLRLEMLEEAVEVMRKLWSGRFVNHRGRYYTVEHARIYTRPEQPPKVYVSAFGPKALELAGRIGDGYISAQPKEKLVRGFRDNGGGDKPAAGGCKACYAGNEDEAVRIAYERWPTEGLPGQLSRELPSPRQFEQASTLVKPDTIRQILPCGPDPGRHLEQLTRYHDAGFDEVYVANIGPHYADMMRLYASEILPQVAKLG